MSCACSICLVKRPKSEGKLKKARRTKGGGGLPYNRFECCIQLQLEPRHSSGSLPLALPLLCFSLLQTPVSVLSYDLETRLAGSELPLLAHVYVLAVPFPLPSLLCPALLVCMSRSLHHHHHSSLWLCSSLPLPFSVCCVCFHFVEEIFNSVAEPSG